MSSSALGLPLTNIQLMTVVIAVRARLFARLREQAGIDTELIALPPGMNHPPAPIARFVFNVVYQS